MGRLLPSYRGRRVCDNDVCAAAVWPCPPRALVQSCDTVVLARVQATVMLGQLRPRMVSQCTECPATRCSGARSGAELVQRRNTKSAKQQLSTAALLRRRVLKVGTLVTRGYLKVSLDLCYSRVDLDRRRRRCLLHRLRLRRDDAPTRTPPRTPRAHDPPLPRIPTPEIPTRLPQLPHAEPRSRPLVR